MAGKKLCFLSRGRSTPGHRKRKHRVSCTPSRPPKVPFLGLERYVFMFLCFQKHSCGQCLMETAQMRRQRTEQKSLTTGYVCNCNAKEITILFCKQIGRSPNTSYTKCRMGLKEKKMEMAGNSFGSRLIFVS
jgi:hypothetical protein